MASLFEAIVLQNLSVLTRGHTLRPHVLLLGGPNGFIQGMREAWQANIPRMWKERKVEIPEGMKPEDLIKVPENAQYFAALGAVEFGKDEEPAIGRYLGIEKLLYYIDYGRAEEKAISGGKGLVAEDSELELVQARNTAGRSSSQRNFCPARRSPVLSASMADLHPPRRSCSAREAKSFARPTSFPMAIRSRMGSRCLRSCGSRSRAKAPRWRFWG